MHPLKMAYYQNIVGKNDVVLCGILRRPFGELRAGMPCSMIIPNIYEKMFGKFEANMLIEKIKQESSKGKASIVTVNNLLKELYLIIGDKLSGTLIIHSPLNTYFIPATITCPINNFLFNGKKPIMFDKHKIIESDTFEFEKLKSNNFTHNTEIIEEVLKILDTYRTFTIVKHGIDDHDKNHFIATTSTLINTIINMFFYNQSIYYYGNANKVLINTLSFSFYKIEDLVPLFSSKNDRCSIGVELFACNSDSKQIIKSNDCILAQFIFAQHKEGLFKIDGADIHYIYARSVAEDLSEFYNGINKHLFSNKQKKSAF